jgi:hypothetical protein
MALRLSVFLLFSMTTQKTRKNFALDQNCSRLDDRLHVRFGSKADMTSGNRDVRYSLKKRTLIGAN